MPLVDTTEYCRLRIEFALEGIGHGNIALHLDLHRAGIEVRILWHTHREVFVVHGGLST